MFPPGTGSLHVLFFLGCSFLPLSLVNHYSSFRYYFKQHGLKEDFSVWWNPYSGGTDSITFLFFWAIIIISTFIHHVFLLDCREDILWLRSVLLIDKILLTYWAPGGEQNQKPGLGWSGCWESGNAPLEFPLVYLVVEPRATIYKLHNDIKYLSHIFSCRLPQVQLTSIFSWKSNKIPVDGLRIHCMRSSSRQTQHSLFLALAVTKINTLPFPKAIINGCPRLNFFEDRSFLFFNNTIINNFIIPWALINIKKMFKQLPFIISQICIAPTLIFEVLWYNYSHILQMEGNDRWAFCRYKMIQVWLNIYS